MPFGRIGEFMFPVLSSRCILANERTVTSFSQKKFHPLSRVATLTPMASANLRNIDSLGSFVP